MACARDGLEVRRTWLARATDWKSVVHALCGRRTGSPAYMACARDGLEVRRTWLERATDWKSVVHALRARRTGSPSYMPDRCHKNP